MPRRPAKNVKPSPLAAPTATTTTTTTFTTTSIVTTITTSEPSDTITKNLRRSPRFDKPIITIPATAISTPAYTLPFPPPRPEEIVEILMAGAKRRKAAERKKKAAERRQLAAERRAINPPPSPNKVVTRARARAMKSVASK